MQISNTTNEIQELELSIEDANKHVAMRDAALKLTSNRDFKKLVLEGYFKETAAQLVSLTADPALKDKRNEISEKILAISNFRLFLQETITLGNQAESAIREAQEALDEIREEGAQ